MLLEISLLLFSRSMEVSIFHLELQEEKAPRQPCDGFVVCSFGLRYAPGCLEKLWVAGGGKGFS